MIAGHYGPNGWIGGGTVRDKDTVSGSIAASPRRLHELKIKEEFIGPILEGKKRAEYRKDDRDFQTGDYVLLTSEHDTRCLVRITHTLRHTDFSDFPEGWCLLSIERVSTP